MEGYSENVIEWIKDEKRATLTLSQRRTISRVKKAGHTVPGTMPGRGRE